MPSDRFLDTATAKAVDAACDKLEKSWRDGRPVSIEVIIEGQAEPLRSEMLRELLQLEWDLRKESDQRPNFSQYRDRFPADGDLVANQLGGLRDSLHQGFQTRCLKCDAIIVVGDGASVADVTCQACGNQVFLPTANLESEDDSRPSSIHGRFLPGTKLAGRYRIVSLIGKGGMGEVYRADDMKLGYTIALKFLPKSLGKDERRLAFFHNEVSLSRQVSHPNVCRVYDIDEFNGLTFLSMEYVDGEDLKNLLRRIGRVPRDKSADIARQLCAGLAAAHACGVLHRDLKPANVMLDGRGRVKITDFGLARLQGNASEAAQFVGTPAYMAPEQLLQGETSYQSDIYSLGVVLYEILVGKPLHGGRSIDELRRYHEQSTPVPKPLQLGADVDPAVERIVLQCLEKSPENRPKNVAAVAAALPGGDPLTAMLAAGDTPSPEMVAAAGGSGLMSPKALVSCLLSVVIGLAIVMLLADLYTLFGQVDPMRPSRLVDDKIQEILQGFGCEDRTSTSDQFDPGKIAYGFQIDQAAIEHELQRDTPSERWQGLSVGNPPAVFFWYRQSPRRLVPELFRVPSRLRGGSTVMNFRHETVSEINPSPHGTGMLGVRLDAKGKLLRFYCDDGAIEGERSFATGDEISDVTFHYAGLKVEDFEVSGADKAMTLRADRFYSWKEKESSSPRIVEAATLNEHLVYFNVRQSWEAKPQTELSDEPAAYAKGIGFIALFCVFLTASSYVCYRNLRMGRGDRKTATLVAVVVLLASGIEWLCMASHAPSVAVEFDLFIPGLRLWTFRAISVWIYYLAAEPYIRRYWPESLTSWCRLFEGKVWDPLIGRDVLLGTLGGTVSAVVVALLVLAPSWFGYAPTMPFRNWDFPTLSFILSPQFAIGGTVMVFRNAILHGVFSLFLLFLLRMLIRKPWLAAAVFLLVCVGFRLGQVPAWYYVVILVWASIGVYLLTRYGLIACTTWLFVFFLLTTPLAATGWYFGYGLFFTAIAASVALYGFFAALGGRPLISDAQLSGG